MKTKIFLMAIIGLLSKASFAQYFEGEEIILVSPDLACTNYWQMGDGTEIESSDTTVMHSYSEAGTYNVMLITHCPCEVTGVTEIDTIYSVMEIAIDYGASFQVAPNPYQESCQISFELPEGDNNVHLWVIDEQGNEITRLQDDILGSGYYSYTFSAKELGHSWGNYRVQWEINGFLYTYPITELP